MKFQTVLVAAFAACLSTVTAQFSGLPSCAQQCATNALPSSCGGFNATCICSTSSFISSISCCVANACDAADQATTLKFAEQICAVVGVTNLPTAASCSATSGVAGSTSSTMSSGASAAATTPASSATTSAASSGSSAAISPSGSKTSTSAVPSTSESGSSTSTHASSSAASSSASSTQTGAAAPLATLNGAAAAAAGVGAAVMFAAFGLA